MTHDHSWRGAGSFARRRAYQLEQAELRLKEAERIAEIPKIIISGQRRFEHDMDSVWNGGKRFSADTPIMDIAGWGDEY